ncbi:MAG: Jag N-terminal domain-containing protein [Endomicrobium sp.]|jgi:spoIIIJ-associated protein|nr:Jag N-terminal domain-containing protein [Endomicrobium sp.]
MPEIEFKGKSVAEAINNGLSQLGCKKEDVEIKIVSEGSTGLFGLMGGKPAVVLISVDDFKCDNKVLFNVDSKKICKKAESILLQILSKMGIEVSKIESSFKDDTIIINMMVANSSLVIGKSGQTLDALEYITQIITNKEFDTKVKVNLDCEDYRKKQNEKLKIRIDKAVEHVKRTGKIYRFDPMNAKERKIIHLYLKDNTEVESFSEGQDVLRKVGIKLAEKKPI